jgi:DNA-binding transcriptional regulator YiaG
MKKRPKKAIDLRRLRQRLGLNQREFWSPLGVTQSGGSRYESDRAMPPPVEILLRVVYLGRRPPRVPKA